MPGDSFDTFDSVRDRLDEIVKAVNAPDITLDAALALYEEAVKLGLAACDLSEEGAEELLAQDESAEAAGDADKAQGDAAAAAHEDANSADDAAASAPGAPQEGASVVE